MIKVIELIVVVTLMVFSFVVGVKYSDSVKSHAGWLFETKEEEVDLPDLTNEATPDAATVYDNGAVDNGDQMPQEPMDNTGAPLESGAEADVAKQSPEAIPNAAQAPKAKHPSAPTKQ